MSKPRAAASTVDADAPDACAGKLAILYVVPRFPSTSQTFVVNEWARLARVYRMEMASLFKGRSGPVHRIAERALPVVAFAPVASAATLRANLRFLRRTPGAYLSTLGLVALRSFRRPAGGTLKGVLVFWKAARLAEIVEERRIDHVHAHFIHHPATAAWAIARLTAVPFSVTAHADDLFLEPALLAEKVRDAAFVATISGYNEAYIRDRVGGLGRIEVVHCGVDVDEFAFRAREAVRRLVCVARLERKKGHAVLLGALARLLPDYPTLTLELIGSGGERKELEALAQRLRIAERVEFAGAMTADEVRAALASADAFVLPARAAPRTRLKLGHLDGIPVALMEAMASGLPVVATAVSGIPELVLDGVTGVLVAPGDEAALAEGIRRLVEDAALRSKLAAGARAHVEREFNADVQAARLAARFAEVATARKRQPAPS